MIFGTIEMEYGIVETHSAVNQTSARGRISIFQKS